MEVPLYLYEDLQEAVRAVKRYDGVDVSRYNRAKAVMLDISDQIHYTTLEIDMDEEINEL
jgi:hypothetical protein